MNILITILLVIGGLIALILILALLIKREVTLEKSISINAPKQEVFEYVRMLKNQEKFNVWIMKDPKIQISYSDNDGTIGATSSWKSDDKFVGIGEQEIKKIHDGESIEHELRFKKPMECTNYALTTLGLDEHGNTKVTSRFSARSKFPLNVMNPFMDKMLGKDMLTTLNNLKNILEKQK